MLVPVYTQVYKTKISFSKALGYAYDALTKTEAFDALSVWKNLEKRIGEGIYMGSGLLLPHTRIKNLSKPLMSFVVADEFLNITIPKGEKAQFLCLLLSPLESANAHTLAIAQVAKLILDASWKQKALLASSNQELLDLFCKLK